MMSCIILHVALTEKPRLVIQVMLKLKANNVFNGGSKILPTIENKCALWASITRWESALSLRICAYTTFWIMCGAKKFEIQHNEVGMEFSLAYIYATGMQLKRSNGDYV